jgi:outer membrane protein
MFRKTSFFLAVLLFGAFTLAAQTEPPKYGHMNLGNLLDAMPETKGAEDSLKIYAAKLAVKDSIMTQAFQEAFLLLRKQYEARELTQIQVQQRQGELEKQRQEIQAYEAKAQQDLEAKRGDLLKPILAKIDEAIKAVAKENGFMMIFDISTGSMLFASETIDVTPLVRKKLGMQ